MIDNNKIILIKGMKRAIHECQLQFKNEKWDCKVLGTRDGIIPFNSPFLNRGNQTKLNIHTLFVKLENFF